MTEAIAKAPAAKGALRAPSFRLRASTQASLSHDGTRLAQLGQRLVVWDVPSRKIAYEGKLIPNEHHAVLSPDGRTVAVKDRNGRVVFFDVASQNVIASTPDSKYDHSGKEPAFSADGRHLLDVSHDATLHLWDVATGAELARYPNFGYSASGIATARGSNEFFVVLTRSGEATFEESRVLRIPGMDVDRAEVLDFRADHSLPDSRWSSLEPLAVDDAGTRLIVPLSERGAEPDRKNLLVSHDIVTGESVVLPLPAGGHYTCSIVCTGDGLVVAAVHDYEQTRGREKDFAWKRTLELEHVYFFDALSGERLARWHWNDAWHLGHSPVTGALAIGSAREPGACLADAPFTRARAAWLAAHPRNRP